MKLKETLLKFVEKPSKENLQKAIEIAQKENKIIAKILTAIKLGDFPKAIKKTLDNLIPNQNEELEILATFLFTILPLPPIPPILTAVENTLQKIKENHVKKILFSEEKTIMVLEAIESALEPIIQLQLLENLLKFHLKHKEHTIPQSTSLIMGTLATKLIPYNSRQAEKLLKTTYKTQKHLLASDPKNKTYKAWVATTCNNLGLLLSDTSKYEEAKKYYDEAWDLLFGLREVRSLEFCVLCVNFGDLLLRDKDLYGARGVLEEGLKVYDRFRWGLDDVSLRGFFVKRFSRFGSLLCEVYCGLRDFVSALRSVVFWKGREFKLGFLNKFSGFKGLDELRRLRDRRRTLERLYWDTYVKFSVGEVERGILERVKDELRGVERRLNEVIGEVVRVSGEDVVEVLRRFSGFDLVFLEYFFLDRSRFAVFIYDNEGIKYVRIFSFDRRRFYDLLRRFFYLSKLLLRIGSDREGLKEFLGWVLSGVLWRFGETLGDISEFFGGVLFPEEVVSVLTSLNVDRRRLVILPNVVLHFVPWEVLRFGDGFLGLEVPFSRCLSADILYELCRLSEFSGVSDGRVFLFMNPTGDLALGESLVDVFRDVGGMEVFYREECTRGRFLGVFGGVCGLVHFDGHAVFTNDAGSSGLRMSDGLLSVRDLFEWSFRGGRVLGGPLVFLCACETNIPELRPGDELLSPVVALHHVGASSVVGSNWPVELRSSSDLSRAFYESWLRGVDASMALLKARREVYKRFLDGEYGRVDFPSEGAYFWGGFGLNGWPLKRFHV